jgi:hypothetical protein
VQPLHINAASSISFSLNCAMVYISFILFHWRLFPFTHLPIHPPGMKTIPAYSWRNISADIYSTLHLNIFTNRWLSL